MSADRGGRRAARRLGTAATVAALLGVATIVAASPAQAATCVASGCNGRSPVGTTCANDARTLDRFTVVNGFDNAEGFASWTVELRTSPSCQASWTRATGKVAFDPGIVSFTVTIGAWSRLNPALPATSPPTHTQAVKEVTVKGLPSFQFSTPMVNDSVNHQVRSCSSAPVGAPCTAWQHL
ncbi:MAG: DUF2690 domain-containing protein [Kineosporiaceae bacterium]